MTTTDTERASSLLAEAESLLETAEKDAPTRIEEARQIVAAARHIRNHVGLTGGVSADYDTVSSLCQTLKSELSTGLEQELNAIGTTPPAV